MVVLFLLIAALTTSSILNRSLSGVLECKRLEEQLQDRWARISLQRSVLERGDRIFTAYERINGIEAGGTFKLEKNVTVADKRYAIQLSDEEAKVNLLHGIKTGHAQKTIGAANLLGVPLRTDVIEKLAVVLTREGTQEWTWPSRSWSSVLQNSEVHTLRDLRRLKTATEKVTLWGSGRLHLKRATPEVIAAHRSIYGVNRQGNVRDGSELTEPVNDSIVERSSCYSLWLIPERSNVMATFTVQWSHLGSPDREGFAW